MKANKLNLLVLRFPTVKSKDPNVAVSETLLTYLPTSENAVAAEAPYMVSGEGKRYKLAIRLMMRYCT